MLSRSILLIIMHATDEQFDAARARAKVRPLPVDDPERDELYTPEDAARINFCHEHPNMSDETFSAISAMAKASL